MYVLFLGGSCSVGSVSGQLHSWLLLHREGRQNCVRNYLRVAPGLCARILNVTHWVCAVGHRSSEVGPKFLMPWRDRLNFLIWFVRKVRCVCRGERRMLYGKPQWEIEQSVQGKQLLCKKVKIKVASAIACQRRLFFLEIFVRPVFCQERTYMLSNVQMLLRWFTYIYDPQSHQCNRLKNIILN